MLTASFFGHNLASYSHPLWLATAIRWGGSGWSLEVGLLATLDCTADPVLALQAAVLWLRQQGVSWARDVEGGLEAWAQHVDRGMPVL